MGKKRVRHGNVGHYMTPTNEQSARYQTQHFQRKVSRLVTASLSRQQKAALLCICSPRHVGDLDQDCGNDNSRVLDCKVTRCFTEHGGRSSNGADLRRKKGARNFSVNRSCTTPWMLTLHDERAGDAQGGCMLVGAVPELSSRRW